jgi:hypothetical protein
VLLVFPEMSRPVGCTLIQYHYLIPLC